jgi:hypothetical protein
MRVETLRAILCEENLGLRKTTAKKSPCVTLATSCVALGTSTLDPLVGQYLPEMGDTTVGRNVINAAGGSMLKAHHRPPRLDAHAYRV